jgi:non-ribosomal peptide synthetase component F
MITHETGQLTALPFAKADIEQTVPARFERVACRLPDQEALVGNGQRWTYQELNRRVNQLAHAIRTRTRPGLGCVAFLVDHSPGMVITTLAVLKAGKVYLALHPEMPAAAGRDIVRDAAPDLLLTTSALEARARSIAVGLCATLRLDEISERDAEEDPPSLKDRMTWRRSFTPQAQPASRREW